MRRKWTAVCVLAVLMCLPAVSRCQTAVGGWRDCLDYSMVLHVEPVGRNVYAAARGGLFRYDTVNGTLTRMNKTTGLSDAGVATIAYDTATRTLVIAYSNSNIDLLKGGKVYNLSDIKRSGLGGDKSIYRIRFRDGKAWLATGFGIVVVDLLRHEIKETCYIGSGGTYTPVSDIAFSDDSLYAATGEGLKRVAVSEPHPTISERWTSDTRLAGVTITMLDNFAGHLLVGGFTYDPGQTTLYSVDSVSVTAWNGGVVRSMHVGGGYVTLTHEESVVRYDTALRRVDSLTSYDWGALSCFDAVYTDSTTLWVGHEWGGLFRIRPSGNTYLMPDGPYSADNVFRLVPFNYRMMLCPGGHLPDYSSAYFSSNLFTTTGHGWKGLDLSNGLLNGTSDLVDVAVNPYDTNEIVAALWGHGVASIRDNRVQMFYDEDNTGGALAPYVVGNYRSLRAGAVAFDNKGNLWTLLSNSNYSLAKRASDGTWSRYSTAQMASLPVVDKLVWDSITGYLWFCGRDNIIYVHDGVSRMARVSPNNGSKLSTDNVTALVQDRSGNLWVGTNKGIKVIYNGYQAFANGGVGELSPVTCNNITITNGEFSEYLMAYESITAIAVDGANRKWVGTSVGGLYLISANGMEQLEHFTAENSPLFSNKIVTLGIQPRTGEVYIGTDQGLQVYRSTATYAESFALDDIHAFPNPVRPDYDGPIAIKGFTRDGLVHITDASGHTIYSTQSLGGQAIWNGCTASGERVASGVYYVFASDALGTNRSVAKILVVR
ncbi:MAG: hypothetical protein IK058_05540 [Bacteroidales bacterium]|nr:hypothetical protein [Bacteroidales bacterium]